MSRAAVSGVGSLLNVLIIIVVLEDPLKILRKGSWITIINLSVADLVVCVRAFFWEVEWYVGTKQFRTMNYFLIMSFLTNFAISASSMLVAFLSLQVYTVTKAPHFWTRNKVALCCVSIWLLAIPLGCDTIFIFLHPNFDKYMKWWTVLVVVWGVIVIIQIVLKILTCWEIFKTRRNIRQSQSSKHRQITTTVMIMVVIQMFTAVPYIVIVQLHHDVMLLNYHRLRKIMLYQSPLVCLNLCVNPIICFLRLPDYRSSLLSLCGCRKRKKQTSSDLQRNEQRELALHHVPPTTSQPPS